MKVFRPNFVLYLMILIILSPFGLLLHAKIFILPFQLPSSLRFPLFFFLNVIPTLFWYSDPLLFFFFFFNSQTQIMWSPIIFVTYDSFLLIFSFYLFILILKSNTMFPIYFFLLFFYSHTQKNSVKHTSLGLI